MSILRISILFIIVSLLLCCEEYNGQSRRDESMVHVFAGNKLFKGGHFKEAEGSYTDAIEIDDKNSIAYFERARAKYRLGDFEGSKMDNTKCIELAPEYENAYFNRALDSEELEEYTDAIQDYTKVIEIAQNFLPRAYYRRGLVKITLKDKLGACLDFSRAGELGHEDAYNMIHEYCQDF